MQKKRKKIRNSISLKRNGCKTAQCLIEEKLLKLVNFPTSLVLDVFKGHDLQFDIPLFDENYLLSVRILFHILYLIFQSNI